MAFWQIILIFSAVGAFFVLWPLVRISFGKISTSTNIDNDEAQVELYNEHLADLEKTLRTGDIDQIQFSELKSELQKNLVAEGKANNKQHINRGGKKIVLACALAVPVVSFILYQRWGAEKDWNIYELIQKVSESKTQEEYSSQMRQLAVDVQQRLNQQPDNIQLRNLLGQTSMALQDYDQAVRAYEEILKVYPESATVISNLAQALFYREGHVVTEKVREYTHQALALAPMLPEMLGLAGIDAKNRGDFRGAIDYWKSAVRFMDPNSASAKGYLSGIANAEKALIAAGESLDDPAKPATPTLEATAKAGSDSKSSGDVQISNNKISVNVTLGEGVSLSGNETLYIYARAWQGAKVPLAIQKMSVSSLPVSIVLDESMAMAPGMTISKFPTLEVVARISRTGGPIAQSGDWQASVGPVKLAELKEPVNLVISSQLP